MENDIVKMLFLRRQRQKKRWKIKTISGAPPLSFKAKAGALKNYRIYGSTENKTRSYSGSAPLSFPIVDGAVSNYRVYGQTSRNLFDMKKFAELCYPRYASVTFADNTLSFTSTDVDAYVNIVHGEAATVADEYRPSCIDVLPSTTYTISMSSAPKCYISWVDSSYKTVSAYTRIPANQTSYTFTTPSNCTKLLIRLGKEVANIGDTFTISNIMLNTGSTALPYETYGESVGDRTENLFNINTLLPYYIDGGTGKLIGTGQRSRTFIFDCEPNTSYVYSNTNVYGKTHRISFFSIYPDSTTSALSFTNLDSIEATNEPVFFTTPNNANYVAIYVFSSAIEGTDYTINDFFSQCMVNSGSTPLPYEPYGYCIPITNNSETSNIYLDEPLRKVGDEAEYVDYATQKRYNADGTNEDVTLPALPSQSTTNSLSVGTAIQPSSVAVDVGEAVSCGDKVTDSQSVNYGKYKIPVTLTAGSAETTDIYLDEPISKSGNNADYIDYATQKRHNSDGTESSVTLPEIAVTAGTNTLTVGTEVQPSGVEITGRIKKGE